MRVGRAEAAGDGPEDSGKRRQESQASCLGNAPAPPSRCQHGGHTVGLSLAARAGPVTSRHSRAPGTSRSCSSVCRPRHVPSPRKRAPETQRRKGPRRPCRAGCLTARRDTGRAAWGAEKHVGVVVRGAGGQGARGAGGQGGRGGQWCATSGASCATRSPLLAPPGEVAGGRAVLCGAGAVHAFLARPQAMPARRTCQPPRT